MRHKPRRRSSRAEQAVAIVTVVLVLSIMAVVGLGMASMGAGHLIASGSSYNSDRAMLAAEAGLSVYMAEWAVDNPQRWGQAAGFGGTLSSGQIKLPGDPNALATTQVNVTINAQSTGFVVAPNGVRVPPGYCYFYSTGTVNNNTVSPTRRAAAAMCYRQEGRYKYPAFAGTIFDGMSASSDQMKIVEWDGTTATAGTSMPLGQIATNGADDAPSRMNSDKLQVAKVLAGPGCPNCGYDVSPNSIQKQNLASTVPIPNSGYSSPTASATGEVWPELPTDYTNWTVAAPTMVTGGTILNPVVGAAGSQTGSYGDIVVQAGGNLTLSGTGDIWVKSLTMQSNSQLYIPDGPVHLYCYSDAALPTQVAGALGVENLKINGSNIVIYNASQNPNNFEIICRDTRAELVGIDGPPLGSTFGPIAAPDPDVGLQFFRIFNDYRAIPSTTDASGYTKNDNTYLPTDSLYIKSSRIIGAVFARAGITHDGPTGSSAYLIYDKRLQTSASADETVVVPTSLQRY